MLLSGQHLFQLFPRLEQLKCSEGKHILELVLLLFTKKILRKGLGAGQEVSQKNNPAGGEGEE